MADQAVEDPHWQRAVQQALLFKVAGVPADRYDRFPVRQMKALFAYWSLMHDIEETESESTTPMVTPDVAKREVERIKEKFAHV